MRREIATSRPSRGSWCEYCDLSFTMMGEGSIGRACVCAENLVWGARCQERFSFFFISSFSNSFVRPRRSHSSAPAARSESRRAQRRSRMAPSSGPPRQRRGASLTAASTTAGCVGSGRHASYRWFANRPVGRDIAEATWFDVTCDTASCSRATKIRGELAIGVALIARHSLVFGRSFEDRTMMQSCASAASSGAAGPF